MNERKYISWFLIMSPLLFLISCPVSAADIPQNNALDMIISKFETETSRWEPIIHNLTLSMFWGLATISFTWAFIQLALKEGTGLVDVLAELVRRVLLIGFSIWMLNEAPDLARTLINSFRYVGDSISNNTVNFSPSNVFELGLNIIGSIWEGASIIKPAQTLLFGISALIVLVCFALMAMEMTILIVSSFVIVSGGIVAMGFLGSEWTRDNAINYFTAVLGVAFKMFIMHLVFIIGYSFIEPWGNAINPNSTNLDLMVLLGASIVFAGLMREIPSMAASLASGRFSMQGGGVGAAITTAAAITAGATLLGAAAAKQGYDTATGAGEGGGDTPQPSQPQPRTMDTGAVDDGKGFAAKMQASASGASSASDTSSASSSSTAEAATSSGSAGQNLVNIDDNPKSKHRATAAVKNAASTAGNMTKGALEHVASRSAVGQILADGAKRLGEDPVDPTTANPEEIQQQLDAALNKNTVTPPTDVQPENDNRFRDTTPFSDNITSAENPYEKEEERDSTDSDSHNGA